MLAHIGSVKFPLTGPLTYTMDAADAVELIGLAARVVVPVHVEGWSHFSEQEAAAAGGLRRGARRAGQRAMAPARRYPSSFR